MLLVDGSSDCTALRFEGHAGPLLSLALSCDDQTLVTCAQGDGIRMWDVGTRHCVRHLKTCFQSAQITSLRVCRKTASPTPLPEFKPLQRVVAKGPPQCTDGFAR